MTVKVRMLTTSMGSENGYVVREYLAGATYDLGEALAEAFLKDGAAESVADDDNDLTSLNLKQLLELAAREGIDVNGAKNKGAVVAAIEAAQAAAASSKQEA
jgi:hypothetical protein